MLTNKSSKAWIDVRGDDGSVIRIRTSEINLIQLPPSRLALKPGETPHALILIGNTPMNFPVPIGEIISNMMDEVEKDKAASDAQNRYELNGLGPARN
jgi:hypothetical protein